MKKILIIPHQPAHKNIKIRLVEVAKTIGKEYDKYEVYLLNWNVAHHNYSIAERIKVCLKDFFKTPKILSREHIKIVDLPTIHRPLFLMSLNSYFLKRFIYKNNIDIVINGSYYLFPAIKNKNIKYIFDLADVPIEKEKSRLANYKLKKVKQGMKKADTVTVVSESLSEFIEEKYGYSSTPVSNGANINKFERVTQTEIVSTRKKLGIENNWVIGYIGQIGNWIDIELTINAFKKLRSEIPEAILLWIGNSKNLRELKQNYSSENIIFYGGVEHVEKYFKAIDVGIMPSKKSLFQNLAFHLKIIEYTAAKKFIISTRLAEVQKLDFPNIFYADTKDEWISALLKAKESYWQDSWNKLVQKYDWKNISNKFIKIINQL